jgi:LPXTG-motif cell wall-anchored protein/uncharacterized repeat protein (TIGR01451 family)
VITVQALPSCVGDTPYLDFAVRANFPPSNGLFLTWGPNVGNGAVPGTTYGPTEYGDASSWVDQGDGSWLFTSAPFGDRDGALLWPGTTLGADLYPTDWPGWVFAGGEWVQTVDDEGGNLRPQADLTFTVNPTDGATVDYPPLTPTCSANPPATLIVEKQGPTGTYPVSLTTTVPGLTTPAPQQLVLPGTPAVTFERLSTDYLNAQAVATKVPYTLSEAVLPGFRDPTIRCDNGASNVGGSGRGVGASVALTFEPGATVRCTIVNEVLPADLKVVKDALAPFVVPDGPVSFTITVTNNGPGAAQDVGVAELAGPGFAVTGVSGGGFSCSTTLCTKASMAPGESQVLTVTATVAKDAVNGQILTNVATVTAQTPDPDPANNRDDATVPVQKRLPDTGTDPWRLAVVGLSSLLGGLFVVLVSRRRRFAG